MARAVYSARFLNLVNVTPGSRSYTVPAGYTAIVRDADLVEGTGTAGSTVELQGASNAALTLVTTTSTNRVAAWRGRQVLLPGESISVFVASGTWSGAVSGYLLTNS